MWAALPFAYLTSDLNYVPSSIVECKAPLPLPVPSKCYFRPQLDELHTRFRNVEALGSATLGEWRKGLEASGQEKNADAIRFEQYELQNGFARILLQTEKTDEAVRANFRPLPHQGYGMDHTPNLIVRSIAGTPSSEYIALESSMAGSIADGKQHRHYSFSVSTTLHPLLGDAATTTELMMTNAESQSTAGKSSHGARTAHAGTFPNQDHSSQSGSRPNRQRTERTHKEAKEAKAERCREIERRCLSLDPPIMPSTLRYMEAFQAAILISLPLDDRAWEILKPRLLAQRLNAEQQQSRNALNDPSIQQARRQQLEEEQRVAQENTSHMWDGLKIPVREKLRSIAEDFIRLTWSDGDAVRRSTASKFAAEVLTHIRQRFDESIAQEDHMLAVKGTAYPQDSESLAYRKLKLQDMKWVFVEFVQPHTQRFGKDLFLCHVCDNNPKLFAFEAIIQHFASKHTNSLSHGTSTVSWEAAWPADPLFDPHPNIGWALGGMSAGHQNQPRPQSHSIASQGLPSVNGDELAHVNMSMRMVPQHPGIASRRAPSDHLPSHVDPLRPGYGPGRRPDPFSRHSVAGSEISGLTMDDEILRRVPGVATSQRVGPTPQYQRSFFAGGKLIDQPFNQLPYREAAALAESQDFDSAQWWGSWREDHPLSLSSMVFSQDDGSSRLSHGGSLLRAQEVGSETGRASEAPSHISFNRQRGLDAGIKLTEREMSRIGIEQNNTNSAVEDFLESFNPATGDASAGKARIIADAARSSSDRVPLNMAGRRPGGVQHQQQHPGWNVLSSPPAHAVQTFSPPLHRASLPIRESDREVGVVASSRSGYNPPPLSIHGHEIRRTPISGGLQDEGISGQLYQNRYGGDISDPREAVPTYSEPMYEHRYFYDREGRRYEQITETGTERYAVHQERLLDRSRRAYIPGGVRYLDDRGPSFDENIDRASYGRALPRGYPVNDMQHRSQGGLRSSLDDQYHEEDPLFKEHQPRTIGFDDRDVTYQPVIEPPVRPTTRSLGVGTPDHR